LRIEAALDELLDPGARLLHVGVGNSSLASRFASRCKCIVGLTLSGAEKRHGDSLAIAGYSIEMLNKYSAQLDALDGAFDVIVDNNLSSFGCCVRHFELMLASYARLLLPGGLILTDRVGMHWTYRNGPMRLRYDDLETIARSFPFAAQRISSDVFALRRRADQ
jgi:cyclopropane fatty-acyl-phospholipid synthase-like methyltransferase